MKIYRLFNDADLEAESLYFEDEEEANERCEEIKDREECDDWRVETIDCLASLVPLDECPECGRAVLVRRDKELSDGDPVMCECGNTGFVSLDA